MALQIFMHRMYNCDLLILQTHHDGNFFDLLAIAIETCYGFGSLFIFCEMGQRINLAFAECSEMADQFDWYLFPTKIQRMLPMIFRFTQRPLEIVCFGSTACDRDTFKLVNEYTYSLIRFKSIHLTIISILFLLGDQQSVLVFHGAASIL